MSVTDGDRRDDFVRALRARLRPADDHPDEELAEGIVELIDSVFLDAVPAARRLLELLEERGWSGWTQLKPKNT